MSKEKKNKQPLQWVIGLLIVIIFFVALFIFANRLMEWNQLQREKEELEQQKEELEDAAVP